jgi:cell division protein FtsQ
MMTLSSWTIEGDRQIEVEGLQLMSPDTLRSLLDLTYPQSLWRLETHQLSRQLETSPPVARAIVRRHLFPPKVVIQVTERQPVALAVGTASQNASSRQVWGFLDEHGIFIPQKFYQLNRKGTRSPTLKVIGYDPNHQPYWQQLYPLIDHFPLKILAIDWQDSSNLVLITELGKVHIGDYRTQLAKKLSLLAKMRDLSAQIPLGQIVHIDLSHPDSPVVQLKQQPGEQPLNSLVKID